MSKKTDMRKSGLWILLAGGILLWGLLPEILINLAAVNVARTIGSHECSRCLDTALTLTNMAVHLKPDQSHALTLHAEALIFAGRSAEAIILYKSQGDWPPALDIARAVLAEMLAQQGEWEQLDEVLADWPMCDAQLAAKLFQRGQAAEEALQEDEARATYLAAFHACPRTEIGIRALQRLAQEAARAGRMAEALQDYRLLIETSPVSAPMLADYAQLLLEDGAPVEALRQADQAIVVDSTYLGGYAMRGQAHYLLGQYELAISDLEWVVQQSPVPSQWNNWALAQAYYRSDQPAEATLVLRRLLIDSPDFQPAADLLRVLGGQPK